MRPLIVNNTPEAKAALKHFGSNLFSIAKQIEKFLNGEITAGTLLVRWADHESAIVAAERRLAVQVMAQEQAIVEKRAAQGGD